MTRKKVLAIGAHPDDIEEFCGGTLILLKQLGFNILIAVMTSGECGTSKLQAEKIVRIRQKEAKMGARKIGAKYTCLDIRDGCVSYDLETTKKLVRLIRKYSPQIIFTHPTKDYMTDHSHAGRLVLWAIPEATHSNFPANTKAPALETYPHLYHTDPQGLIGPDGQIAKVNTIVDISKVIDHKLEAIAAHQSQVEMPSAKSGKVMQYVEETRRSAITRGNQVGVEYGEGFFQQLFEKYPRRNIIAELLKNKVFTL